MTKAGSMTGVGTKYLFPWCCCLNLANNVSSVAWGKLRHRDIKSIKEDKWLSLNHIKINSHFLIVFLLALFIQQVEQTSGLLADEMNAANIVCVVDVVPGNSFCLILLLNEVKMGQHGSDYMILTDMLSLCISYYIICCNEARSLLINLKFKLHKSAAWIYDTSRCKVSFEHENTHMRMHTHHYKSTVNVIKQVICFV